MSGAGPEVFVDTDLALGAAKGDVDDGFAVAAVLLAARAGRVRLLGLSATAGNTDADTALHCLHALLAACPGTPDLPVVARSDAPQALARLPEGVTVLALGPLTNVAAALSLDPRLASRVEVRVVGSVARPLRAPLLPLFDLNRRRDPAAWRAVARAPWRGRIAYPLDVVRDLRFGRAELDRLQAASAFGRYLAAHSERWLRRAPLRYLARTFPVWDLVPVLHWLDALPGAAVAEGRLTAFDAEAARENALAALGA